MKKLLVPTLIALLIVIVLAGSVLAAPATAAAALPFKGTLQSVESYVVNFPIMSVTAGGSGHATHLGLYTIRYEVEVNLLTLAGAGSAQIISANGDVLYAELAGQASPTEVSDVFQVVEVFTITGGTGRFAGASGSITLDRTVNTLTGVTSGTFEGNILLP